MPLINPDLLFDPPPSEEYEEEVLDDESIDEVLASEGLIPGHIKTDNNFQKILNTSGASVADAAFAIAGIMKSSKYDNAKLKAAEIILDLHGVRDKDGKVEPKAPTFNFVIQGGQVNMQNVFAPERRPGLRPDLRSEDNSNWDEDQGREQVSPSGREQVSTSGYQENTDEMFKDIVKRVGDIEARRLLFEGKLIEPAYGEEEIINDQYFPSI